MWSGFGDTVREPQWLWAGVGAAILALLHLSLFKKKEWGELACALPWSAWVWFLFLLLLPLGVGGYGRAYPILLAPALVLLCALAMFLSPLSLSRRRLLQVFFAVTVVQLSLGLLQIFNMDPFFYRAPVPGLGGMPPPAGFAGQHTLYGLLAAWLAYLWLMERRWGLLLLCVAAVLLTKSAFALASLGAAFLWFGYCRGYKKSASTIALICVCVGAHFFITSEGFHDFFYHNGRLFVWVLAVRALMLQPWLGFGIGGFSKDFHRHHQGIADMRWEEAHNEWIEYAFNTGVVGVLFLLPFLFSVGYRFLKLPVSREKELVVGTMVVLGVNSMGNFPLQIAPFACLAIFALAWVYTRGREPASTYRPRCRFL